MKSNGAKGEFYYLLFIFFFVVLSLFLDLWGWNNEPMLARDGCLYAQLIKNIVDTGGIIYSHPTFLKPPMFLLHCAVLCRFTACSPETSLLAFNFVFHAGCILMTAIIAEKIFHSRVTALFCAFLITIMPEIRETALNGTREPAFIFYFLVSIYCFMMYCKRKSTKWLISCSFFSVISLLCRIEGGCVLLIFFYCLLVYKIKFKQKMLILLTYVCSSCISLFACCALSENTYIFVRNSINHIILKLV